MRIDTRQWDTVSSAVPVFRVLIDGLEVTDQCFMADEEAGEVGIYLLDDSGHFYRDPNSAVLEAAQEIRHGRVVLAPKPAGNQRVPYEILGDVELSPEEDAEARRQIAQADRDVHPTRRLSPSLTQRS